MTLPVDMSTTGTRQPGDLTFRCNVDYSGIVHNLRVHHANSYRG